MERNFYNDDFEEFLKQKADQNRMYPSDRVWNNVYGSLHNRRRWFAIGVVLLLVTTGLMVGRRALMTGEDQIAQKPTRPAASRPLITPAAAENSYANIGIPAYKGVTPQSHFSHLATANNTADAAEASPATITANTQPANTNMLVPGNTATGSLVAIRNEAGQQVIENDGLPATSDASPANALVDPSLKNTAVQPVRAFRPSISVTKKSPSRNDFSTIDIKIPLRDRWSMKLYGSPIMSYRRMSDLNKSTKYVPVAISYSGNIDNYVHHKPAIGFELGTRIQYKLSPSLSVFSGVQLNYSRYYIDAYKSVFERATIALTSSTPADTLSNYTTIRNFGGYAPQQLQNQYFQVAIPFGAELKLMGNDRIQLGVAASVQPTYMLASSTYLISSDFKNYVQNNDLVRRLNVHTSFEAFISYETPTGLRWQLGPEFRYQLMSSYSNQYPIREYITEFGIKLGITRIFKHR